MVKIICDSCYREVEVTQTQINNSGGDIETIECKSCHEVGFSYEDEDEQEESDDETCTCDECDKEYSEDNLFYFSNSDMNYCEKCISSRCSKLINSGARIEYVEKIVEKPIYITSNNDNKEINKKGVFDNIL